MNVDLGGACAPSSFVFLDFERTTLVQSNLGGGGGRCGMPGQPPTGLCEEETPRTSTSGNMHLLFRDVGVVRAVDDAENGALVWLRVTNESECASRARPLEHFWIRVLCSLRVPCAPHVASSPLRPHQPCSAC